MPRTKPTTRPAPSKPGSDGVPLTLNLPGGGQATFYAEHELTPRRTRALEVKITALSSLLDRLANARKVTAGDGTVDVSDVLPGAVVEVTEEQAGQLSELNDLAAFAYLKDWTLDRDLPASPDDLLDLPILIYRALVEHAAKLLVAKRNSDGGFTVDSVEDPTSPTGASAA